MTERKTSSKRPYLIRAMHEWMGENGLTPHIVVDALHGLADLPSEHVKNGKMILNISYDATQGLQLGNEEIAFDGRFGGLARHVAVPITAILGIYARETGQGMIFTEDETSATDRSAREGDRDGDGEGDSDDRPPGRGHLKVVK